VTQDLWFANQVGHPGLKSAAAANASQTTNNACATVALFNIIMNAERLTLGEKLLNFKQESRDLNPPLRGNMISNSAWVRMAHNSFARYALFNPMSGSLIWE
jgi:Ubiquitin carboxyl-terminal hydrolase, family 1